MFLRNHDNYMLRARGIDYRGRHAAEESGSYDESLLLKDRQGRPGYSTRSYANISPFYYNFSTARSLGSYWNYSYAFLWCGSGTRAVDYDDYDLEKPFDGELDGGNHIYNYFYDTNTHTWTISYTRAFKAHKNIEINEVGIYYYLDSFCWVDNSGGYSSTKGLFYRKVLPETVSVAKGKVFKITIDIPIHTQLNKPADYVAKTEIV